MPIICDYSGIAMGSMFSQKTKSVDENLVRHQILNSLRMYNVKYRKKYGELIVACDGGSWRKHVFAEYKAARKINREQDGFDWAAVWDIFNKIKNEIKQNLPYKVVQVKDAEADDIIATLVERTQEFGCADKVMIISADKDFIQLQKYSNVEQFSPFTKKLIKDPNPHKYLMEHILRGDSGDGVPNILSPDNVFLTGERQKPLTAKLMKKCIDNYSSLSDVLDDTFFRNFIRNRRVIDLSYIPEEVTQSILDEYHKQPEVQNSKILSYLISHKCKMLIGCAADFFPSKTN